MLNRIIALALILSTAAAACKSKKQGQAIQPVVQVHKDTVKELTAIDLIGPILKDWTSFSSKVDVEFRSDDGKSLSPSANIRMYRDSLIWISGGMFGIEGFRMLINKDSAVMLNKLERTYTVYKTSQLAGFSDAPVSVAQLQNLLLARPVFALELYKKMTLDEVRINIRSEQSKIITSHSYNRGFMTLDTTSILDRWTPNFAEARYYSYTKLGDYTFPNQTSIRVTNNAKIYTIDLKYSDTEFNVPLNFPFTIPASYARTK